MSILICSTKYDGCGHVGKSSEWTSEWDGDLVLCPKCWEDHTFQITDKNIHSLTDENNYDIAKELLDKEPKSRFSMFL